MEDWKNLLKWQYILPAILFIFTMYAWYIETNSNIEDLKKQEIMNNTEISTMKTEYMNRFNKYDIDIAVVKQDNVYIKNSQDIIIRKLDDYTYMKK